MGYTQSLRPEQMGLALQMDMAVTAFLEPGPVIDYLTRAAGLRNPHDFARASREQVRKADKAISGIKVRIKGIYAINVTRDFRGLCRASAEREGQLALRRVLSTRPHVKRLWRDPEDLQ